MSHLSVNAVSKSFGSMRVLKHLDLEVESGSLLAILGPSGSGKTTLLRVLAGFEPPDEGTIALGGSVVDGPGIHVPPDRRRIGYVPQEGALFPHLSVGRNVAFGISRKTRRSGVVGDLLEVVGMRGMGSRSPHELSGGQQHRVALARALAVNPELVLLDEPFSGLDKGLRENIRREVASIIRLAGTTAILVTHDQDEAMSWAEQVVVLDEGRARGSATPEDLYRDPKDAKIARFVGDANFVVGTLRDDVAETALGPVSVSDTRGRSGSATLMLRPEQIRIGPPSSDAVGGTVVASEYHGHDVMVTVKPDGGEPTFLSVRALGVARQLPGTRVSISLVGPGVVIEEELP